MALASARSTLSRRGYQGGSGSSHALDTARSMQMVDPSGILRRAAKKITNESLRGYEGGQEAVDRLMQRAVRVGDARMVEDTVKDKKVPTTMHRVIVRDVEVPIKRQVKVPVKTKGIRPVKRMQRVRVKRLVEVPDWKEVDEEYTVTEQRAEVRDKEVWVKKVVQETVMVPFKVKKTRKKKIPTTKLKEVEDWEDVEVTEHQAVEIDGFRVDEVDDTKVVQVEEVEEYVLVPKKLDRVTIGTKDVGRVGHKYVGRHLGDRTYTAREVAGIPLDERPSDVEVVPAFVHRMRARLGMILRQSAHERRGLIVRSIKRGGPADRAGLVVDDIITHADGVSVTTLDAFRRVYQRDLTKMTFTVLRGSQSFTFSVTKGELSSNWKTQNVNYGKSWRANGGGGGGTLAMSGRSAMGGQAYDSARGGFDYAAAAQQYTSGGGGGGAGAGANYSSSSYEQSYETSYQTSSYQNGGGVGKLDLTKTR